MTWIHVLRRRLGGGFARWAVVLAIPAMLGVGCGDDDDGKRAATPTATRPPATATATAPSATATAPAATATAPPATATPTPVNTAAPTPTMGNTSASAACEKLVRCGQCFSDSTGSCITTAACAERLSADVVLCLNAGAACSPDMLGDCLFLGCDGADATAECQ